MPRLRQDLALGLLMSAAACAPRDPLSALPPADRAALLAEPGTAGRTPAGGTAVADMLARARVGAAAAPKAAEPLVLRFSPGAVQPDPAQRGAIEAFAAKSAGTSKVLVVSHRAEGMAGPDALLGQRRAVAVARLLEPSIPEVEMRFEPEAAAGEVVLLPDPDAQR